VYREALGWANEVRAVMRSCSSTYAGMRLVAIALVIPKWQGTGRKQLREIRRACGMNGRTRWDEMRRSDCHVSRTRASTV